VKRLICRVAGHRLETSVHARKPTLYCSRCKRAVWWVHEPSGLIVHWDTTRADLERMGVRSE
jgi:hypothetical protein